MYGKCTVEPVYKDHPRDQAKVVSEDRWSFVQRFFTVVELTYCVVQYGSIRTGGLCVEVVLYTGFTVVQ